MMLKRIAQWDPYDQNATADWFDPEWMFGITEGFDIVIGNPPYIQLQKDGGGRLGKSCIKPCKVLKPSNQHRRYLLLVL